MRYPLTVHQTAVLILAAAVATIAGALVFEHVFGLLPCKLCLVQRNPYFLAIPLALLTAVAPVRWAQIGLIFLALVFLASAGLAIYHSGVEWGFFAGPTDCGGTPAPTAGSMGDFLKQLETTRIVSCTEAAWRFLGLSLAGWNVLISLALVGAALAPLLRGAPGGR